MDHVSSILDGSLAITGVIAAVAGSARALRVSESITPIDTEHADVALRSTLKKAA